MANIQKRKGSYKITVSAGRDMSGKQIRYYMTWTPPAEMTERQAEKEVQKIAADFERKIDGGFSSFENKTFAEYADYVLQLKAQSGVKPKTIERYKGLLKRINPAIGHIKVSKIRPAHLNLFYSDLLNSRICKNQSRAFAKADLMELVKKQGGTQKSALEKMGLSRTVFASAAKGNAITRETAEKIAAYLKISPKDLFEFVENHATITPATAADHHRLISTILAQAEKEMIVPYNAAAKATPPKPKRKEASTFQPDEVVHILEELEQEPLKWKTIVHLLVVTGCRRGEIAGLKWDKIDWEHNLLKIDMSLLYSASKGIYEAPTKTGNVRFIKIPVETMSLLAEYRRWFNDLKMQNLDKWEDRGFLFVNSSGKPMHPDGITIWLSRFSVRHNIPDLHPHKLRHTMASMLYFERQDSVTISKRLGHSKVSTTTDIYSHLIAQADERASECIANAVLRPSNKKTG